MIRILITIYLITCLILLLMYCSLQTDHRVVLPSLITKQEIKSCKSKKPEFFSTLVIEENRIYWTKKDGSKVICVKERRL
jgi:hypothetical protein